MWYTVRPSYRSWHLQAACGQVCVRGEHIPRVLREQSRHERPSLIEPPAEPLPRRRRDVGDHLLGMTFALLRLPARCIPGQSYRLTSVVCDARVLDYLIFPNVYYHSALCAEKRPLCFENSSHSLTASPVRAQSCDGPPDFRDSRRTYSQPNSGFPNLARNWHTGSQNQSIFQRLFTALRTDGPSVSHPG